MPTHRLLAAGAAFLLGALPGCVGHFSTRQAGLDYNRSFADSRNDILLLNILRASAREPLQFSTIASVVGGMRPSPSLKLPFTNVIAGGADVISPELTLGIRNPNVTIQPLETREFVAGLSRPVSHRTLRELTRSGPWPGDALVLAIGGVHCSDGRRIINSGDNPVIDGYFRQVLTTNVSEFEWKDVPGDRAQEFVVRMTAAEAVERLAAPLDGDRIIIRVDPIERRIAANKNADQEGSSPPGERSEEEASEVPEQQVLVTIGPARSAVLAGAALGDLCHLPTGNAPLPASAVNSTATSIMVRSIQGMFHYLGEVHRSNGQQAVGRCTTFAASLRPGGPQPSAHMLAPFRLRSFCDARDAPVNAAVSAEFHGRRYYVLREQDANAGLSDNSAFCRAAASQLRQGPSRALVVNPPTPAQDESPPAGQAGTRKPTPPPPTPLPSLVPVTCDRTMITLAILGELIALQTSDSTVATSRPVIAIAPQ